MEACVSTETAAFPANGSRILEPYSWYGEPQPMPVRIPVSAYRLLGLCLRRILSTLTVLHRILCGLFLLAFLLQPRLFFRRLPGGLLFCADAHFHQFHLTGHLGYLIVVLHTGIDILCQEIVFLGLNVVFL